jgi:hypothetical protein
MARISISAAQPFIDLRQIVSEISWSAYMLGNHYWRRQGRGQMTSEEREKHLKEMHDLESMIWDSYEKNDPIRARVDKVIADIESVIVPVIQQRPVGFILTDPVRQLVRKGKDQ